MVHFSGNVLLISLLISIISGTMVYLALHFMFVRPLTRLTYGYRRVPRGSGKSRPHRRADRPPR